MKYYQILIFFFALFSVFSQKIFAQKKTSDSLQETHYQILKREILYQTMRFVLSEHYGLLEDANRLRNATLSTIEKGIPKGCEDGKKIFDIFKNKQYIGQGSLSQRIDKLCKNINTELSKLSKREDWRKIVTTFYQQLKENRQEIEKNLAENTYQFPTDTTTTAIPNTSNNSPKNTTNSNTSQDTMAIFIAFFLFLACGAGIYYLLLQIQKLQQQVKNLQEDFWEKYSRLDNRLDIYTPLNDHKATLIQYQYQAQQIEQIIQQIQVLQQRNQYKISPEEIFAQNTQHLEPQKNLSEMKLYYGYFEHGIFHGKYFRTEPTQNHFFKIEINLHFPQTATYKIVERSEYQQLPLQNHTQLLAPVCTYANPPYNDAKIMNLEEGILEKKEDYWIIKRKLKISFEK